jgi:DNA-binding transcriptional MerR regulator
LYSVGQVADMLDVQPAFLRRLDTEQVVMPSRSAGGQRRYSRTDIDRVHAVTGLLAEGMTLAGALRIMELQAEIADLRGQLAAVGHPAPIPRPTDCDERAEHGDPTTSLSPFNDRERD